MGTLAALESSKVLHLRPWKKYYLEAFTFIKAIESSMDSVIQLPGSTHKAEVLELMEFCRVTSEYEFQTSEVVVTFFVRYLCLTTVPAWDQTPSFGMVERQQPDEDEKELKGVRSRLLESYRNLYFDSLPDTEPKQQVNWSQRI